MPVRDVIIVGGGPSGLSAAIAAKKRGLDYQILEQGTLVNSIYRFPPQMVFFTTPELLEIGGLPFVSPYDKPTRAEALKYYRRVVDTFDLQISFEEKVLSIASEDVEAERADEEREAGASGEATASVFALETRSSRGVRRVRQAHFVVLATGYYDHPNMLNVPGEDLPHVHHYYSEPHPYYRQRVVIVGGGNSAAEAALEMYRAGARVTIVHRWPELKSTIKYWVRPDIENRIKEGSIAARFGTCLKEIRPTSVVIRAGGERPRPRRAEETEIRPFDRLRVVPSEVEGRGEASASERAGGGAPAQLEESWAGGDEELPADAVFLLVGYHADWDLQAAAGIEMTDRHAPIYNPQTFETNVPGLFVAGGALAGFDTGTIFIENGRFHGEKIIEEIDRRLEA